MNISLAVCAQINKCIGSENMRCALKAISLLLATTLMSGCGLIMNTAVGKDNLTALDLTVGCRHGDALVLLTHQEPESIRKRRVNYSVQAAIYKELDQPEKQKQITDEWLAMGDDDTESSVIELTDEMLAGIKQERMARLGSPDCN